MVDRNTEACLIWLQEELKLTKEEKNYILNNHLVKTVKQMAEELNLLDRKDTIRNFLRDKGLKAVRER